MSVLSRCRRAGAFAVALVLGTAACSSATRGAGSPEAAPLPTTSPASSTSIATPYMSTAAPSATSATSAAGTATARPGSTHPIPAAPQVRTPRAPAAQLPLGYSTADATQVITATAGSTGSTSGTLQAWQKVSGGWAPVGPAVRAWFGSQGLTGHMSEQIAATPIGSFTLTQAFGHNPNPGTGLPYWQTDSADWWMSETSGPDARLYNTHQRCTSASCPFHAGSPNEHLAAELPYYNYVVVIDYNTANAPGGVRLGAGSAVFLHVTDGSPTAGCVAIDQSRLVAIMQWLRPSAHPRILIGVA